MACCWICLQPDGQLTSPCSCPRLVHSSCLACWQIHSAGTPEEHTCRFCAEALPDWRETLAGGSAKLQGAPVPVVSVLFEGREHRLKVPPTPEGALRFQKQIELITGLPFSSQVNIKFYLRGPTGQENLTLTGTRCLDAAIHCAAIQCAKQHQQEAGQQPTPGAPPGDQQQQKQQDQDHQQAVVQPQPGGDATPTHFQQVIQEVQQKQLQALRAQQHDSSPPVLLRSSRSAPAILPREVQAALAGDGSSTAGSSGRDPATDSGELDSQLTSLSLDSDDSQAIGSSSSSSSSSTMRSGAKPTRRLVQQLKRSLNSLSLKLLSKRL